MMVQSIVGGANPYSSISTYTQVPQRSGQLGDVILSELQPRYYEQGYRGNVYTIAMQSPTYISAGRNVIYNGLCLSNPITSSVNIVLLKAGYSLVDVPVICTSIGLMVGYSNIMDNVHTNNIQCQPAVFQGLGNFSQQYAEVDTACQPLNSIPTPVYIFSQMGNGSITNQMIYGNTLADIGGSIVLAPGAYVAFYSTTTTITNCFMGSFVWEEVSF